MSKVYNKSLDDSDALSLTVELLESLFNFPIAYKLGVDSDKA